MLKSMTAYGRAHVVASIGRFVVELYSVNRKHLEINTVLPKELLRYDADIKKWIAAEVGRGQVNVKISLSSDHTTPLVVTPNLALARQLKTAWEAIAQDLGMELNPEMFLKTISRENGILLYDEDAHDEQLYRKVLHEVISQALQQFLAMKVTEGLVLYEDIAARFAKLSLLIKEVALKAPGATTRYRQRLIERLEEVLGGSLENEEKILREVSVYAERVDIAEELTRFDSHLQQVNQLFKGTDHSVGKTLEFLVQEFNREINTIGSKSSDVEVARLVIEIKSELEKIREQIQNIE